MVRSSDKRGRLLLNQMLLLLLFSMMLLLLLLSMLIVVTHHAVNSRRVTTACFEWVQFRIKSLWYDNIVELSIHGGHLEAAGDDISLCIIGNKMEFLICGSTDREALLD